MVITSVVLGHGVSCTGFREDEIECEQAVVRLRDCCPGFHASQVDCTYNSQANCAGDVVGHVYPALALDESRCIQRKTCGELVDTDICMRAEDVRPLRDGTAAKDAPPETRQPVCTP